MLKFSAEEVKGLGLTFELHISKGYVVGGPWITNETVMKRLTCTETLISGSRQYTGKLSEPKIDLIFIKT